MDGSVGVYNWNELLEKKFGEIIDPLILECAFTRGDYLYKSEVSKLLQDQDIKKVLYDKISKASEQELLINSDDLNGSEFSKQDNPAKELPTDICIYYNTLFSLTDSGIFSSSVHGQTKYGISTRSKKLWDCSLLSIQAYGNKLAMAGGEEGVFELHRGDYFGNLSNLEKIENGIYKISDHHSSFVNWSFASLYSSSYVDSGFLAAFGWNKNQDTEKWERNFKKIIPDSQIFEQSGFSWGSQEKIYLANCNTVEVVEYVQSLTDDNEANPFQHLASISLENIYGNIICGGISYFGVIIECEESLTVLCSDYSLCTFSEPVARWRVYPRSKRYENHLHVIYENKLVVYSFNHDYFIDQDQKNQGIKYKEINN